MKVILKIAVIFFIGHEILECNQLSGDKPAPRAEGVSRAFSSCNFYENSIPYFWFLLRLKLKFWVFVWWMPNFIRGYWIFKAKILRNYMDIIRVVHCKWIHCSCIVFDQRNNYMNSTGEVLVPPKEILALYIFYGCAISKIVFYSITFDFNVNQNFLKWIFHMYFINLWK